MRIYELRPASGQKSFYGKAQVHEQDGGKLVLYSYGTPVASINASGTFTRLRGDWSATTGKHIRAFCSQCGIEIVNKAVWDKMPVATEW